jgi:hypothetical protein
MSNALYGYSQSNDSYALSLPLADGTFFAVLDPYSEAQSKAVVVRGHTFSDSYFRSYPHRHLSLRLVFPWSLLSDCWLRSLCVLT